MKKILITLIWVILSISLFGCNDDTKQKGNENKVTIQWPQHLILYSNGDNYVYYSITEESVRKVDPLVDGNILDINSEKHMVLYEDSKSKEYYLIRDENKVKINIKDKVKNCQISPDGEKILYSEEKEDGSVSYFLYSIEKNSIVKLDNLMISGDMYFWKDGESIVFYGIDDEGRGGIFEYNVNNKKIDRSLIVTGIVEKFEKKDDSILYIVNNEDKRETYLLNQNDFTKSLVSNKIVTIGDFVYNGKEIYFTGKAKDNVYSLYKVQMNDGKPVRLVYDFPSGVVENKKILSLGNKLIFIGCDESNNQIISRYDTKERVIDILIDNQGEYNILF